jgi:hypothetical protein
VVLNSTLAAAYSVSGSCGEKKIGKFHWKRYFAAPLAGAVIHALQRAVGGAAVDDLGVVGIGDHGAGLAAGGGLPVALADRVARRGAAADAQRRVVLLAGEQPVREGVVGRDAVELRGRLVGLRRPVLPAVKAHVRAALVGLHHAQRVGRIDPQIEVVAVRRADRLPAAPAVAGAVKGDVEHVHRLLVERVGVDAAVVPGALAQAVVFAHAPPALAAIARAEHTAALGLDDRVHVLRVGG